MNSDDYAFKAGQTIPGHHWIVVAPIGAGGMGEVYEVRGEHIDRRYVLKTLLKELRGDEMAVKRFYAEAKFLGSMKHEKIVNILVTGETIDEHKQPFFVMEKVYGSTLNVLLKVATKLDLAYACDVFAQIAHALHVVHESGIIHGDVKPLNIMFQQGTAGLESVKILDFGIARKRETTATGDLSARMGTPRYLAPEQARCEKLTPAADIYAFFVILYEAVTQQYPWPHATTDESQINAHLRVPPQPLESFGDYPARLSDLVRRALAKDPLQRPQSMALVEEELKAVASEIRGLNAQGGNEGPTVKRLLAVMQEAGRDDGAPSSSRHRTEESGPPAARAHRAGGTSNGVKSELIVGAGDEGETQDLVPVPPKPGSTFEPPPRQRTVRMVLPVDASPIVVVGLPAPMAGSSIASRAPGAPHTSSPPGSSEQPFVAPIESPAPAAVAPPQGRALLDLESVVKTSVPAPLEALRQSNVPATPPARSEQWSRGSYVAYGAEPHQHQARGNGAEPLMSVHPTEPMAVVVADRARLDARDRRATEATPQPDERASGFGTFGDAFRPTAPPTGVMDPQEPPTPAGVVRALQGLEATYEPADPPADRDGATPALTRRRALSSYAAPLVFAAIVGGGIFAAAAIVRKPNVEQSAASAERPASAPSATSPLVLPALVATVDEPRRLPVSTPTVSPSPAPSVASSAVVTPVVPAEPTPAPAEARVATAPVRRAAPPPVASAKPHRPGSGLDFEPETAFPSSPPPASKAAANADASREHAGNGAGRSPGAAVPSGLDSLWEVRTPTAPAPKKK